MGGKASKTCKRNWQRGEAVRESPQAVRSSERKYKKAGQASVSSYKASWERLRALQDVEMFRVTIDSLQKIVDQDAVQGLSKSSIQNDKMLMKITLF